MNPEYPSEATPFLQRDPRLFDTSVAQGGRIESTHFYSVDIPNVTVTFLSIAALLHLKLVISHSYLFILSCFRNLEYNPTRAQIGLQA